MAEHSLPKAPEEPQSQAPKTLVFNVDHIPYDIWIAVFEIFILIDEGGCAKLLAVSTFWRNLVKASPSLWMELSVAPKDLESKKLEARFRNISPRAIFGLDICCPRSLVMESYVDVSWLRQYIPRIKTLTIRHGLGLHMFRWQNPFENLGELTLGHLSRKDMFDFQQSVTVEGKTKRIGAHLKAPNLRRVVLHDVSDIIILPLPWHQMTCLSLKDIRNFDPDDFFIHLVARFGKQLKHLKAMNIFTDDPDHEWLKPTTEPITPVPINALVSLEINFGAYTKPFLERATFPKLEHIDLTSPRNDIDFWFDTFTRLAERSKFPLKSVIMRNSPIILDSVVTHPVHVVKSVLSAAPSITSLVVLNSALVTMDLVKALESPELGPNLGYLKVVGWLSEFNGFTGRPIPRMNLERERMRKAMNSEEDDEESDEETDDDEVSGGSGAEEPPSSEDEGNVKGFKFDQGWGPTENGANAGLTSKKDRKTYERGTAEFQPKLPGYLETMLTKRHKDSIFLGRNIVAPDVESVYKSAAVICSATPSIPIGTMKEFEDFCVREGEVVREDEIQRVHVFF